MCTNCKCPCLLISLKCLIEEATILNATLDSSKLTSFMDKAQKDYIMPIIQEECFSELCTAVGKDNLPPSHEDYEALPEKWSELLSQVRELIISGTEYLYVSRRGYGFMNDEGFNFKEDVEYMKELTAPLKAEVEALQNNLRSWLEDNSEQYSCYVKPLSSYCEEDEEDDLTTWEVI